jgi:hypothetical protein
VNAESFGEPVGVVVMMKNLEHAMEVNRDLDPIAVVGVHLKSFQELSRPFRLFMLSGNRLP